MTSYMDSESYTFVHPRAWAIGGIGGIYTCFYTHGVFCCYKYKDTAECWVWKY